MALYGQKQKATAASRSSEPSSSTGRSKWHYPKTKREAIDLKDLGARISLSMEMAGNITNFLQTIGADNELPNDHRGEVQWLNHFHTQLAVNNPLWPEDLPFGYVYGGFVNAVIYERVPLKGHNIQAFISAFRDWITQAGVEDNLRRSYWQAHPEAAPKQLEKPGEERQEDPEAVRAKAEGLVNFSPAVVKQQIAILEGAWGGQKKLLKAFTGAENYVARLYATREKMQNEGTWEES